MAFAPRQNLAGAKEYPCACGDPSCIIVVQRYDRHRQWRAGCPAYEERVKQQRCESAARKYREKRLADPKYCRCGCGRVAPIAQGVRYAPDCPNRPEDGKRRVVHGSGVKLCQRCQGMPWRREYPACRGCGDPYAAEPPLRAVDYGGLRSSAGSEGGGLPKFGR